MEFMYPIKIVWPPVNKIQSMSVTTISHKTGFDTTYSTSAKETIRENLNIGDKFVNYVNFSTLILASSTLLALKLR